MDITTYNSYSEKDILLQKTLRYISSNSVSMNDKTAFVNALREMYFSLDSDSRLISCAEEKNKKSP